VRPWIKYSLIRLSIFIVVLVVLLIIGMNPFLAAVVAAVAGFVIAYVFFRKVRDEVAAELAERGTKAIPVKNVDTDAEDEALDAQERSE
jgi:hypothetical protein